MKEKWNALKKVAKKASATQRREIHRTGGGSNPLPQLQEREEAIMEVIAENIAPLPNPFDSDRAVDMHPPELGKPIENSIPPDMKDISFLKPATKARNAEKLELLDMKREQHLLEMKLIQEMHDEKLQMAKKEHDLKVKILKAKLEKTTSENNRQNSFLDNYGMNYMH